jgi:hypothetical protein
MRGVGEGWGLRVSANEYSGTHGAQINFGVLTPYRGSNLWEEGWGWKVFGELGGGGGGYVPYKNKRETLSVKNVNKLNSTCGL